MTELLERPVEPARTDTGLTDGQLSSIEDFLRQHS
jgi:hypothetical protein